MWFGYDKQWFTIDCWKSSLIKLASHSNGNPVLLAEPDRNEESSRHREGHFSHWSSQDKPAVNDTAGCAACRSVQLAMAAASKAQSVPSR